MASIAAQPKGVVNSMLAPGANQVTAATAPTGSACCSLRRASRHGGRLAAPASGG